MRWQREADGAQLRLHGGRLIERLTAGGPWRIVRVIEGSRLYRSRAAHLYASTHGYQPAPVARDEPVAIAPGPLSPPPPSTPGAKCAVIVPPPGGRRVNLEVSQVGAVFWARRCENGGAWVSADRLAAALAAAVDLSHDAPCVLAAAARVAPKLNTGGV